MPKLFVVVFACVFVLTHGIGGTLRLWRLRHLDDKLRLFGRLLGLQAVALLVVVVSPFLVAIEPAAASADEAKEVLSRELLALGLVLVSSVPAVLHVMRELASFVLVHRTDLLARDQAASFVGPARRSDG